MTTRLRYPELAPEGYAALAGFGHYVNTGTALEPVLLGMVYLRASVLNGCAFCTEMHTAELRKHNEPESRIAAVLSGNFGSKLTPREQAALQWTAAITNVQQGHASDEEYAAVGRFFAGKDLVDLTFAIANINAWNRMGVAFRPEWRPRAARQMLPAGPDRPMQDEKDPMAAAKARSAAPESGTPPTADDSDGGKVGED